RGPNPIMATAADICIAEVDEIVETGELDPESIITPSCFTDRIVKIGGEE
ncbi:CoA-transferase, partial [Chloroflexota bacterium]